MSAPGQPDLEAGPAEGQDGEGGEPLPERKRTPQQIAAEQRLKHSQKQVDEVVDIMRTNVEKVLERDSKLAELDYRSDKLQEGASMFEKQAGALKNKFWLENMKMMIVMGIMGLIVVAVIYFKFFAEDAQAHAPQQPQIVYYPPPPNNNMNNTAPAGSTQQSGR